MYNYPTDNNYSIYETGQTEQSVFPNVRIYPPETANVQAQNYYGLEINNQTASLSNTTNVVYKQIDTEISAIQDSGGLLGGQLQNDITQVQNNLTSYEQTTNAAITDLQMTSNQHQLAITDLQTISNQHQLAITDLQTTSNQHQLAITDLQTTSNFIAQGGISEITLQGNNKLYIIDNTVAQNIISIPAGTQGVYKKIILKSVSGYPVIINTGVQNILLSPPNQMGSEFYYDGNKWIMLGNQIDGHTNLMGINETFAAISTNNILAAFSYDQNYIIANDLKVLDIVSNTISFGPFGIENLLGPNTQIMDIAISGDNSTTAISLDDGTKTGIYICGALYKINRTYYNGIIQQQQTNMTPDILYNASNKYQKIYYGANVRLNWDGTQMFVSASSGSSTDTTQGFIYTCTLGTNKEITSILRLSTGIAPTPQMASTMDYEPKKNILIYGNSGANNNEGALLLIKNGQLLHKFNLFWFGGPNVGCGYNLKISENTAVISSYNTPGYAYIFDIKEDRILPRQLIKLPNAIQIYALTISTDEKLIGITTIVNGIGTIYVYAYISDMPVQGNLALFDSFLNKTGGWQLIYTATDTYNRNLGQTINIKTNRAVGMQNEKGLFLGTSNGIIIKS